MTRTEVSFLSDTFKIAAHLYVPDSFTGAKLPAIVVVHPFGGVKEQTAGLYAELLSNQGFVTLPFDRRYQGASDGTPRQLEDPFGAAEDIKSAVTFLSLQEQVDPSRIGILGICAGGGYVIFSASTDHRIKAVATISGVDLGSLVREIPKPSLDAILADAGQARIEYAKTGEVNYLPILPALNEANDETASLMAEGADYYLTPHGGHPNSINRTAVWSYDKMAIYDSFAQLDQVSPRPFCSSRDPRRTRWRTARQPTSLRASPRSSMSLKDRPILISMIAMHLRSCQSCLSFQAKIVENLLVLLLGEGT